jgi:hypothetical protein
LLNNNGPLVWMVMKISEKTSPWKDKNSTMDKEHDYEFLFDFKLKEDSIECLKPTLIFKKLKNKTLILLTKIIIYIIHWINQSLILFVFWILLLYFIYNSHLYLIFHY